MNSAEVYKLCRLLVEMKNQYASDLCGDHRAFYGRRIEEAFVIAGQLFPAQMADQVQCAGFPAVRDILEGK